MKRREIMRNQQYEGLQGTDFALFLFVAVGIWLLLFVK